jgi:hypothetical protein
MSGMVVRTCNLSYWGCSDHEGRNLGPAQAKMYRDPISTDEPCMVMCACHPSYMKGVSRRNVVQATWSKT